MPATDARPLKETPLDARHRALGAKMVPFAGYAMPVQYGGVLEEHRAVRRSCGIFDVSHMGTIFVSGPAAADLLQSLLTNDVSRVDVGRAQYTLLCNDAGGVVDDLIISRLDATEWVVVPNAANVEAVAAALLSATDVGSVRVENVSSGWGILAVQGPQHRAVVDAVLPDVTVERFRVTRFTATGGETGFLSGTGYTGESGIEIVAPASTIVACWDGMQPALSAVDGCPAGLGARDTLRLEMGYPLHGQDMSPTISPLEAGLGWAVKFDKGDFVGAKALRQQLEDGVPRTRVGILTPDRRPPRTHCPVLDAHGAVVGEVTSGNFSPTLGRGIGLALVEAESDPVALEIRGRRVTIEVADPPFI